jgi:sulfoxide reductase catalytic subunit YedY
MTIIRVPKSWEIAEQNVTSETVFLNRRRFFKL